MFKIIFFSYRNTLRLLTKKPQVILFFMLAMLAIIPLEYSAARFEQSGLNKWFSLLSDLIGWMLTAILLWLVFQSEGITDFSLSKWLWKYLPRLLFQSIAGFFFFSPVYLLLLLIFGKDGLALQPGHTILMASMSIWVFVSITIGGLWLCYSDEGLQGNIKNAIKDVFRNFGVYLVLRLLILAVTYASLGAMSSFATFNGLACGSFLFLSALIYVSWAALAFGFCSVAKIE